MGQDEKLLCYLKNVNACTYYSLFKYSPCSIFVGSASMDSTNYGSEITQKNIPLLSMYDFLVTVTYGVAVTYIALTS